MLAACPLAPLTYLHTCETNLKDHRWEWTEHLLDLKWAILVEMLGAIPRKFQKIYSISLYGAVLFVSSVGRD